MRRLTKRDAERLLATYDDDPAAALATALGTLTGRHPIEFDDAVALLAVNGTERAALLGRRAEALDALAKRLNEERRVELA